jgi:hypothetical protein
MQVVSPSSYATAASGRDEFTQDVVQPSTNMAALPLSTNVAHVATPAPAHAAPTPVTVMPTASPAVKRTVKRAVKRDVSPTPAPSGVQFAVPAAVQAAPTPTAAGVRPITDFNGIMLNAVTTLVCCVYNKNGQTWRKDDETTFLLQEYNGCYLASGVKKNKILIVLQRFWAEFPYRTAGFDYDLATLAAGYRSGSWSAEKQDHFLFWIKVRYRCTH